MKMLFSPLVVAVLLSLVACSPHPVSVDNKSLQDVTHKIQYSRDARTGLCFASLTSPGDVGVYVTSISMVPCEAVEKLLINNR